MGLQPEHQSRPVVLLRCSHLPVGHSRRPDSSWSGYLIGTPAINSGEELHGMTWDQWQTYVESHLLMELPNGGRAKHAAILGHDFFGDNHWAKSEGFPLPSEEEFQRLLQAMAEPTKHLGGPGVFFASEQYAFIRGHADAYILAEKGKDQRLLVQKTNRAALVVVFSEVDDCRVLEGDVMLMVANLADYLMLSGF